MVSKKAKYESIVLSDGHKRHIFDGKVEFQMCSLMDRKDIVDFSNNLFNSDVLFDRRSIDKEKYYQLSINFNDSHFNKKLKIWGMHIGMVFIALCLLLTSCVSSNFNSSHSYNISRGSSTNDKQPYLSLEIFQTINSHEALAHTTSDYAVVKIESYSDIYFDEKKISGRFMLTDTYTYTTKDDRTKTVPVYKLVDETKVSRIGDRINLSAKIFQTLSKNEALAITNDFNVVKLETYSDVFYDDKKISGSYSLDGTYQYETKDGILKTVPVYIEASEYKKIMRDKK